MTASLSHLSHPKYRPDLDGLRAVAVLAVVAFHAFPAWIKGGFIGVDVFFVISGFLISTIIFENLDNGTFSFTEFYARRVRRIFPALIIVLFACFIFGWFILLADEFNQLAKHIGAGAGFVSNLVLWSEAGYFDNSAETKPLLHLWSLGIEEQFYIVWPLLLWFSWKRKFNLLTLTVLVAFVSFGLNINGVKQYPVATFYSPLTRFWELLCGTLLAWFSLYKRNSSSYIRDRIDGFLSSLSFGDKQIKDGKTLANFISFFGLFALAYGFWQINDGLSFPGYWALMPVAGTVLIISAGPMAWVNRIILSSKVAVWFGLISFPLYLWHWPIFSFGRIIYDEAPPVEFKLLGVALSILLSSLTVKLIEKPFRFGNQRTGLKVATLSGLVISLGLVGFVVSKTDISHSHTHQELPIKRSEHAIGPSLAWYRGKEDWLYLGNAYDNTVAKLKLTNTPTERQIKATKELFSKIAIAGSQVNTRVVLIVAPNKSSIYPEYLPDELVPSTKKYSSFFFDEIKNIPNLTVYDPTSDLLSLKKSEGFLYFMTDTHWNNKGAFLTYAGFSKLLGLAAPQVEFHHGSTYSGDLIDISKLKDFPLHAEDNWDVVYKNKPVWTEKGIQSEQYTSFGSASVVTNEMPLSSKYIWVIGDSFTGALRQYFNATFKEVRYVGHWGHILNDLPLDLAKADKKPDMIVVVRVERSF
jgi:peptidoglycan/LPS O-acetylase OafA/YrhL